MCSLRLTYFRSRFFLAYLEHEYISDWEFWDVGWLVANEKYKYKNEDIENN